MKGLTAIVTGGNTGIGYATANEFAARGASVIIGCRDVAKGKKAAKRISDKNKNEVVVYQLDLTDFKSIRSFSDNIDKCHILVNNAGAMFTEKTMKHEVELTSLTNHLGPFYLTQLLLPKLKKTADEENTEVRIVNVGSRLEKSAGPNKTPGAMEVGWIAAGPEVYTTFAAYANSKLCNMLMTTEIARREALLKKEGDEFLARVTVNAVTPGMVHTELSRFAPSWQLWLSFPLRWFMLKSPEQGASTVVYAATSEELKGVTGKYFGDMKMIEPSAAALSEELAMAVWQECEALVSRIVSEEK